MKIEFQSQLEGWVFFVPSTGHVILPISPQSIEDSFLLSQALRNNDSLDKLLKLTII